jgi:hypothetical protein
LYLQPGQRNLRNYLNSPTSATTPSRYRHTDLKIWTCLDKLQATFLLLHRDCPEDNSSSTPACCNCQLEEGEKLHPANYRGCRHAKEEMLKKKKPQETPQSKTGRVFSSNFRRPNVTFAAALQDQTKQPRQQEEVEYGPEPQKPKRKETV